MSKPPSFQFYPADWISHTRHLDAYAQHVLLNVTCFMWIHADDHSSFPNDPAMIGRMCGISESEALDAINKLTTPPIVCLEIDGNMLVSKRLRKERDKQKAYSDSRSNNAKSKAHAQHMLSTCKAYAEHSPSIASAQPPSLSPSSSSSSTSVLTTTPQPPKGERVKSGEKSPNTPEVDSVFEAWNTMAKTHGLPQARRDTKKYRDAVAARLKESEFRDQWKQAIEAVPTNPWNMGKNPGGWRATFKWFLYAGQTTAILSRVSTPPPSTGNGKPDHLDREWQEAIARI